MPNGRKRQVKHILGYVLSRDLENRVWRWEAMTWRWAWQEGGQIYFEGVTGALRPSPMTAGSFTEAVAMTVGFGVGQLALRDTVGPTLDVAEQGGAAAPAGQ